MNEGVNITKDNNLYKLYDLHQMLLKIMSYVDDLCRKNNIEYYIYGGTALGAKRHGGFIPWDDDLDIVMTQRNFDKFIELFRLEKQEEFYLQLYGEQKDCIFAKIRANNTTLIEECLKDKQIHHGIYIDVFVLQNSPNQWWLRWNQYFWAKYISAQNYAYTNHRKRNFFAEIILKIFNALPRFFLTNFAVHQIKKYNNFPTKYYSKFTEGCRYKNGFYEKRILGQPKEIVFENLVLLGPQNVEEFLEFTYNEWRKIPTKDEIARTTHHVLWDVKKNYTYYLKNCISFEDEKYL